MKFPEIKAPEIHRVNAALGWLELGLPEEARVELENLGFQHRYHPEVLVIRWKIAARMMQWDDALDLARCLVKTAPEWPAGHICLAHSLYNCQRAQDALSELRSAAHRFPKTGPIIYFLARLSHRVGPASEAELWLNRWNDLANQSPIT